MARSFSLSLNQCQHGIRMIALDEREPNGDGSGTRLTHLKCCGSWETVQSWPLRPTDLKEIGKLMLDAAKAKSEKGDG